MTSNRCLCRYRNPMAIHQKNHVTRLPFSPPDVSSRTKGLPLPLRKLTCLSGTVRVNCVYLCATLPAGDPEVFGELHLVHFRDRVNSSQPMLGLQCPHYP
ncbi:hypothetical protein CEXT_39341 [Caerostris extrusa]|uniref:Uncharacterized protein n=1 Tax=Caerostris extrusa TaxID=172846 RepID=A0AAV4UUV0_CAEEX|nr:hypothetical protein CEXT_39341 [Caerostris extrusa]